MQDSSKKIVFWPLGHLNEIFRNFRYDFRNERAQLPYVWVLERIWWNFIFYEKNFPKFWQNFENQENVTSGIEHRAIGHPRNENFEKIHLDGLKAKKLIFSMSHALCCRI